MSPFLLVKKILKHMKTLALSFIASIALSFCACDVISPDKDGNKNNQFKAISMTKADEAVNDASNNFGFEVYRSLYKDEQMLISPLSMSLALSMAAIGADGTTAEQMVNTLGFDGLTTEDVSAYYEKMVSAMLEADKKTTFEVANSIWTADGISLEKDFVNAAEKYYSATVKNVNFGKQSGIDEINKWCANKTHNKITKILSSPNSDLRAALLNALYFNGKWSEKFDEKTTKMPFTTIDGKEEKMDMMHVKEDFQYCETNGFKMVRLPYGNGAFAMSVILPDEGTDFKEAVDRLDVDLWNKLDSSLRRHEVSVTMPEFKYEYNCTLNDVLKSLGMEDAFTGSADFSRMTKSESLYISQVIQKTYIDVNTKGTEAAAVTYIGMMATSAGPDPDYKVFTADRPFIYVISETSTGAILFMGQKVK